MDWLAPLPRLTAGLPGTGGRFKSEPADFEVEEIPAYRPSGDGEHLYLWVEKRGLSADALVRTLARTLGVAPNDIGTAGLKDSRAVTRQWVSVPAAAAAKVDAIDDARLTVLDHKRHGNKLRTGHLEGNRFRMVIRGATTGAVERGQVIAERLRATGMPNFYDRQRFGNDGSTLTIGLELLAGRRSEGLSRAPRGRRRFLKRLALSAVQSAVFNACLRGRLDDELLHRVLPGDVMQVCASGGLFDAVDLAAEQARFDAHEVVTTGPMFGPKTREAKGEAAAREAAVLEAGGLERDRFDHERKIMAGTRRPYLVWVDELTVGGSDDALEVRCTLPPGSYATVLLGELVGDTDANEDR